MHVLILPATILGAITTGISNIQISRLQIPFIENQGQQDHEVSFYSRTFAGSIFVTKRGKLVYALPQKGKASQTKQDQKTHKIIVFSEELVAANAVNPQGENKSPQIVNIYRGQQNQ